MIYRRGMPSHVPVWEPEVGANGKKWLEIDGRCRRVWRTRCHFVNTNRISSYFRIQKNVRIRRANNMSLGFLRGLALTHFLKVFRSQSHSSFASDLWIHWEWFIELRTSPLTASKRKQEAVSGEFCLWERGKRERLVLRRYLKLH